MHKTQIKMLELARRMDIGAISKRKLGRLIGEDHPQNVIHHFAQLKKAGQLQESPQTGSVQATDSGIAQTDGRIVPIPIVGAANCGIATAVADQHIESFLQLSPSILGSVRIYGLCAVQAIGNSLNAAKHIPGGPIEDGDYVLVDTTNKNPRNGEYVLSNIDGAANMKKFFKDEENKQVVLLSESTNNVLPIYIAEEDMDDLVINGVIQKVIKKAKFE